MGGGRLWRLRGAAYGPQRRPQAAGRRGGLGRGRARDWLARPSDVTTRRHQRLPVVLVPGTRVPTPGQLSGLRDPGQALRGGGVGSPAQKTRVLFYVFMTPLSEAVLLIYSFAVLLKCKRPGSGDSFLIIAFIKKCSLGRNSYLLSE